MAQSITKTIEKDANAIDSRRVKAGAYSEMIVREQKSLVEAANAGIKKINSDLKALKHRLGPYTTKTPKDWDSTAADLKFRYESKLKERAVLERAREIAEESIVAAKLHMIPGEIDRTPRAPTEKGYHGLT